MFTAAHVAIEKNIVEDPKIGYIGL